MLNGALFEIVGECHVSYVNPELEERHYLGQTKRGTAWVDEYGCAVWASPTARHIPTHWMELTRWCLKGIKNGGSRQFKAMRRWLMDRFPDCTTLVSYSDPSAGHTGALYRACNWLWAPTWHRIVPPPTGNGDWGTGGQSVKDRWVFPLRPDADRVSVLRG